jgi:hypothetical protein
LQVHSFQYATLNARASRSSVPVLFIP